MSCKDISLNKELGSGGYGKVYSFKRKNKKVPDRVIKVLHSKKTGKDGEEKYKSVKKFDSLVEVDTLFRLKSTTITKGLEIYSPGECSEIKSVAIEMEALKDFKNLINDNQIDPVRKILFIYRLAVAINCLHSKKILHLDIKPANMLYTLIDDIPYIKLSDFGLSHQVDNPELGFHTTTSFGTRKYKPPESLEVVRLSDSKYKKIGDDPFYDNFSSKLAFNYTSKFDVWSFGISAIYILESGNDKDSWMDNWDSMTYNEFCDEISDKFSSINKQATIEKVVLPLKLSSKTQSLLLDLLLKVFEINPAKRIGFENIVKHELFSETMFSKSKPITEVFTVKDRCRVENELICNYKQLTDSMVGGLRYIINIFKGPLKKYYARDLFFALDVYIRTIIASRTSNWTICKKTAILTTRIAFRYYYPRIDFVLEEHSDREYAPLEIKVIKLLKGNIRTTNLYDLAVYADQLKVFYDMMIANDFEGYDYYLTIDYEGLLDRVNRRYIIEERNKIITCEDFFKLKILNNDEYEKTQPGR